jgi:hypothetical protein
LGLFKNMKDMQSQAQEAAAGQQAGMGQQSAMEQMGASAGDNMAEQAAYAQMANKIGQSGVEAPGVIHSIRPSGQTDISGGQKVEFDVSVKPDGGEPYQTTIKQSMLPAQMEGISEGMSITVKYDPDSPTSALIYSW